MTVGKRKERDEGADSEHQEHQEHHGSTLFVSNLPYNATSTDLQTLFSDIAPVRNAFIVCEQGMGVSKGVGYVSFAIREDAQMAYDKVATEGLALVGRELRVQWAGQKPKSNEGNAEAPAEKKDRPKKKARPPQSRTDKPQDPLAIRTIVISGLPPSMDSKTLWKKIRKYNGAEKVELPVSADGKDQDTSSAHAVFSTPALALDAINKLHAHVFKGSILSVTLKKRLDTLSSHTKPSAKRSSAPSTATPNHAIRLIVRNLPFTATEQDLRSIFLPYGPIYSINMPLKEHPDATLNTPGSQKTIEMDGEDIQPVATPPTKAKPNKGFAFIWFYSRKDAERAMEGCNAMTVRAGAAEELVKGKQKRKKDKRIEKKLATLAAGKEKEREKNVNQDEEEGEKERDEKEGKKDKNERVIAVDWALSKDKWEEEKAKIEEEMGNVKDDESGEEDRSSQSSHEGEDESEGDDDDDDDDDGLEVHGEEDESDEGCSDGESGSEHRPVKPQLPQTDIGTTLFIRNVPYDATEDELRTLLRSFGPLRYARITMDPTTGRSRGTGFACFWNKDDADKVIQQSEQLKAETTGGSTVALTKAKNPFTLPSMLTPDPSSSLAQNLVLHGRALDVARAVTRAEAGKLKELGERAREKADKRNMYLLREGVILPNSPSAASLDPTDLERRTNSYNARRALLKSNPSLYISKTRLSVRQIPLYVTERVLKRLAIHGVRAFEREVKEGKRKALSEEEMRDPGGRPGEQDPVRQKVVGLEEEEKKERKKEHNDDDDDASNNESESGSIAVSSSCSSGGISKSAKRKAKLLQKLARSQRNNKGSGAGVQQAKIVRQAERVDPITGKGRSRGYGFVEMYTHADALRMLRWANCNSEVPVLLRGWWKEELERLVQVEKVRLKKEDNESDARLKRMVAELEKEKEGGSKSKNQGTLIVEFSIENVQVVQRRNAVQKNRARNGPEEGSGVRKKMLEDGHLSQKNELASSQTRKHREKKEKGKRVRDEDEDDTGKKNRKKRRLSSVPAESAPEISKEVMEKLPAAHVPSKLGQKVGSIIGRKRKERKKGKGGKMI